jgi:glycosyltransferase involved in cell wall biosynthesis
MLKNCDVVFLHTPYPEALPAALLAKVYGKPFVMVHHGDFITPEGLGNRLLRTLAHWCLKLTGRLASAIVSYSRDYAEHSELLGPFLDKTIAIHPPVDIPQPNPDRSKTLRAQLGLTDKKTIGIAGRWVQEKGFDVLLMAFPGLLEIVPDAHIVFAGETDIPYDPAWRRDQEIVRAMSSHITLLGLLKEPQQLADFYGMLDVFVLPSRSDMMALVQIEAMLCGVPVVATDIPGARVPVKETGFGRLASPNDPKALAKGVGEVLSDRPSYAPDVDAARAIFDPQKCFQAYERILGEIVPGGE